MSVIVQKLLGFLLSPPGFALGFIAPLLAQCLTALGFDLDGFHNLVCCVVLAAAWGLLAQWRGSWIWVRP